MKYINYILITLVFAIAYLVGLVLVPFLYPFRDTKVKLFWYFLNDTTPENDQDIDYGDFGRFNHNIRGFYQQCALRNSHWNLKLSLSPKKGVKENVKGNLKWRRYDLLGTQFATYEIDGTKYFRYSYSAGWFYYQFGASNDRYIFKFKIKL